MAAIRGVIFDCDGVLVDSEPASNRVLAEVLTEIGLPTTTEESMAAFMGRSWASNLAVIEQRLGGPAPPDLTERYRTARDAELRRVEPVDGILEALDRIDLPSCVASSGDHAKMAVTLGATGLLDRFRGRIFSAADLPDGRGKPAPDLFLHAARAMGWEPHATAVVEDSAPGVEAGIAAGMHVFGYRVDAPTTFDDMRDLPRLLAA
ncbi:MAG: HAD family hydrolase [Actinomycetota bacterium]|nr:HAD family hydrolase [Actinomycetota bacterium]